jgi:predicted metal-dependent hydrolase
MLLLLVSLETAQSFSVAESATAIDCANWLNNWHRNLLRRTAVPKVDHWCSILGVAPNFSGIRSMKTKWGSCNAKKHIIWLNAELSRKPDRALDYVILHELAHLISERHDELFHSVLEKHMPRWRAVRKELNAFPLAAWEGAIDAPCPKSPIQSRAI